MDRQDSVSAVIKTVSSQLGREARPEHRLREDLGADSLDTVQLFMTIEDEFSVEIPDSAAEKIRTVQDIVNFIDQYKRNR